jgi:hypothetical protein
MPELREQLNLPAVVQGGSACGRGAHGALAMLATIAAGANTEGRSESRPAAGALSSADGAQYGYAQIGFAGTLLQHGAAPTRAPSQLTFHMPDCPKRRNAFLPNGQKFIQVSHALGNKRLENSRRAERPTRNKVTQA